MIRIASTSAFALFLLASAGLPAFAQSAPMPPAPKLPTARKRMPPSIARASPTPPPMRAMRGRMAALSAMEKEIEERIAKLEAKRAEYHSGSSAARPSSRRQTRRSSPCFSQMRPDAAAAQLTAMSEDAAAAILTRLTPRTASAILNEMDPQRAALLATTIAGMSRRNPNEGKPG